VSRRDPSTVAHSICIVVGLEAEAKLARRLSRHVAVSGGRPEVAARLAREFAEAGAETLMSFGIAGGLSRKLRVGSVVVASEVVTDFGTYPAVSTAAGPAKAHRGRIYGGNEIVATTEEKRRLRNQFDAIAVDNESGPVARVAYEAGIPFVAVRVISDAVGDHLPPAALLPLSPGGKPRLGAVLLSVLKNPFQIPGLIATAINTRAAMKMLRRVCRRLSHGAREA
jgi:adenosylhomocysteine nucleosidase